VRRGPGADCMNQDQSSYEQNLSTVKLIF
jgi:hypothetical protein